LKICEIWPQLKICHNQSSSLSRSSTNQPINRRQIYIPDQSASRMLKLRTNRVGGWSGPINGRNKGQHQSQSSVGAYFPFVILFTNLTSKTNIAIIPLEQCSGSMTFWCGSGSGSASGSADPCL
jgi:hypothetical protein